MLFIEFGEEDTSYVTMRPSYAVSDAGSSSCLMNLAEVFDKGIKQPSTMYMRIVCEALYAMWEDPTTSPNDAHLAYYDIKARDTTLKRLSQQDSTYTRLVYRVIRTYIKSVDQVTCPFANVRGRLHC